jgi:hypothetical protein
MLRIVDVIVRRERRWTSAVQLLPGRGLMCESRLLFGVGMRLNERLTAGFALGFSLAQGAFAESARTSENLPASQPIRHTAQECPRRLRALLLLKCESANLELSTL